MKVSFTVPGEPKGKGRPRFSVKRTKQGGSYVNVRTPESTRAYENLVAMEYARQCRGIRFEDRIPIRMHILAYFGIPKSASKKNKAEMLSMQQRPVKKPDMDNIVKAIADSLNDLAYHDDSQIVETTVEKFYGEEPRVEVVIEDMKGENQDE